jgi:hypothetical protein
MMIFASTCRNNNRASSNTNGSHIFCIEFEYIVSTRQIREVTFFPTQIPAMSDSLYAEGDVLQSFSIPFALIYLCCGFI